MKPIVILIMMGLFLGACSPSGEIAKTSAKLSANAKDSTEYEVIIIDPQFDQWYLLNFNPAKDYSDEFYRTKNLVAVSNWNDYYRSGRYNRIIENSLDYNPSTHYGIEVNRKLYWYFKYLNEYSGIRFF